MTPQGCDAALYRKLGLSMVYWRTGYRGPQSNHRGTDAAPEKRAGAQSLSSLPQALFSIFFRDKEPREREICLELAAGISRGLSGRTPTASRWLPEDPVGCVLESGFHKVAQPGFSVSASASQVAGITVFQRSAILKL